MWNLSKVSTDVTRVILPVILLLLAQGCYITKTVYTANIFNTWLGQSVHDLSLQQGSPSRTMPDGNGGQIYVYDQSFISGLAASTPGEFYSDGMGLMYQPGMMLTQQYTVERKLEFFIDKEGIIYAWRAVGYPQSYQIQYTKAQYNRGEIDTTYFTTPRATNFTPIVTPRWTFDTANINLDGKYRGAWWKN